jgi:hypothetical protein
MKKSSYMERAEKHRDKRFAHVLGKLGYSTRQMVVAEPEAAPIEPVAEVIPAEEDDDAPKLRRRRKTAETED